MKYKFTITGLDCPNCAAKLSSNISKLEGVEEAKINFLAEKLTVVSDLSEAELIPLLNKCASAFSPDVKIEK